MIDTLAVANYRSLRSLIVPLARLNVVTGPNGSGKSNLYRALRLLAEAARGRLVPWLAREGGLPSTLWAGPERIGASVKRGEHPVQGTRRKEAVHLRLGFSGDDFGYAIDLGLPLPSPSAFSLDPEIKRECIWAGPVVRPAVLLVDRRGPVVRIKRDSGDFEMITQSLHTFDSMMAELGDPGSAPEVLAMRERIRSWRFYDHFRTDAESPARMPQIGTHTPVLGNDGADLGAALQTIREIGDGQALAAAVADAFPGCEVEVHADDGRFEVAMRQQGLLRPLRAAELSDGTLRYLLWIAALLTPRPPELLVLNEPETSLHPALLPPLGRLIGAASTRAQVVVVSHAAGLVAALEKEQECQRITLEKDFGETRIAEAAELETPSWQWPAR